MQKVSDQRSDQIPAFSAAGRGAIYCSSTSIFMAIPARALAPRIRLVGRLSSARWWPIGVCEMIGTPADGAIFQMAQYFNFITRVDRELRSMN
jgi:hypothetical protein